MLPEFIIKEVGEPVLANCPHHENAVWYVIVIPSEGLPYIAGPFTDVRWAQEFIAHIKSEEFRKECKQFSDQIQQDIENYQRKIVELEAVKRRNQDQDELLQQQYSFLNEIFSSFPAEMKQRLNGAYDCIMNTPTSTTVPC